MKTLDFAIKIEGFVIKIGNFGIKIVDLRFHIHHSDIKIHE